jgi:hypothetical protein
MLAKLNIFYITIYFEGGSVNTRSRTMPKKKGADYSVNAGLMFLFTFTCFQRWVVFKEVPQLANPTASFADLTF